MTPASHHVTGTVGAWSRSSVTVSKPVSSLKAHSRNISVDWDPFGEDSPPGAGEGSSTQAGNSSDGLKSSEQCPAEPEPPVEPLSLSSFRFLNHPATECTDGHRIKGWIVLEPAMYQFLLWVQHQPLCWWRAPLQGSLGVLKSSLQVVAEWGTTRFFTRPVCLCVMWPSRTQ